MHLMVDLQRRKKLALHLRHLSMGLISNDEFEEKCILFLQTEIKYQWPYFDYKKIIYNFTIKDLLQAVITLGKHYQYKKRAEEQVLAACQKLGVYEIWPFFTRQDYESTFGKHLFLQQKYQY